MKPPLIILLFALLSTVLVLQLGISETIPMARLTVYVGLLCPFFTLLTGFYYRKYLALDLKILMGLIAITIISEGLAAYLSIQGKSNYWVLHIFTLVEFSLLVSVIYQWQSDIRVRKFLVGSVFVFFGIWLLNKLLIPLSSDFTPQLDNIVIAIESIFFVAMAVFLLVDLMKDTSTSLFEQPRFWFACALLVYFAGSLLIFSYSNTLLEAENKKIWIVAWSILAALNVIRNFCYVGTFVCSRRLKSLH